jgi:hypothetical protein
MALLPARHNFKGWKGSTFQVNLKYYDDEGVTPKNLTGYEASFVITKSDHTVLATLESPADIVLNSSGDIQILISDEATAAFTFTNANYMLALTSPAGVKDTLLYGSISFRSL